MLFSSLTDWPGRLFYSDAVIFKSGVVTNLHSRLSIKWSFSFERDTLASVARAERRIRRICGFSEESYPGARFHSLKGRDSLVPLCVERESSTDNWNDWNIWPRVRERCGVKAPTGVRLSLVGPSPGSSGTAGCGSVTLRGLLSAPVSLLLTLLRWNPWHSSGPSAKWNHTNVCLRGFAPPRHCGWGCAWPLSATSLAALRNVTGDCGSLAPRGWVCAGSDHSLASYATLQEAFTLTTSAT